MDNVVAILNRERTVASERMDALAGELRDLKQRLREIDEAVAVLTGHVPATKPSRANGGELKDRILACVKSSGADGVTVRDVAESLTVSGRETSEPSVSSTLSRMKAAGEVDNRHGKWFVKSEPRDAETENAQAQPLRTFDTADEDDDFIARTANSRPSAFDSDLEDDVPF